MCDCPLVFLVALVWVQSGASFKKKWCNFTTSLTQHLPNTAHLLSNDVSFCFGSFCFPGTGDEVVISYGTRSNDQLLQLYGFVEPENGDDQYEIRGLLGLVDDSLVPRGRLKLLQDARLLEFVKNGVATQEGFVDQTALAARALVATEAELASCGGGVAGAKALANPAGVAAGLSGGAALDRRVSACLAQACTAELARLPTTLEGDLGAAALGNPPLSERERLALEFRIGKKRVLQRCASALEAAS